MNSRCRFHETMRYGSPDRVPYFEEGTRDDVIETWSAQGLVPGMDIETMFLTDRRDEIWPDLYPRAEQVVLPSDERSLLDYERECLVPDDPKRLPEDWVRRTEEYRDRDFTVMLGVHHGFFLSMGVKGWDRFIEVMYLLADNPSFVKKMMTRQGTFNATITEKVLKQVEIDAVIFSEPIGGNDRPLLSPEMFEEFVFPSYRPVFDVIRGHGIETIIFRTYANTRLLIPSILKMGFNCLWACETNVDAMNYLDIRREFGKELRLIGGIDLDALRSGKEAIRQELQKKVPPLLLSGGYIPLADGRIRADVHYQDYLFYRRLLRHMTEREFTLF